MLRFFATPRLALNPDPLFLKWVQIVIVKDEEISIMANLKIYDVSAYIQALVSEVVEDLQISTPKDKRLGETSSMGQNQKSESKPPNRSG